MEELKSYITANKKDRLIALAAGLVFLAAGAAFAVKEDGSKILMVAMLLGGAVLVFFAAFGGIQQRRLLAGMEESGLLTEAAEDYKTAQPYADGELKLGQTFLFRHKLPEILRYEDIRTIQPIDRREGTGANETPRWEYVLAITLQSGKPELLATFCEPNYEEERQEVIRRVVERNPSVAVK